MFPSLLIGCSSSQFRCNNGFCTSSDNVCNGYNDCGDNSDEVKCGELCVHTFLCVLCTWLTVFNINSLKFYKDCFGPHVHTEV